MKRTLAREWLWLVGSLLITIVLAVGSCAVTERRISNEIAAMTAVDSHYLERQERQRNAYQWAIYSPVYGVLVYAGGALLRLTIWAVRTASNSKQV